MKKDVAQWMHDKMRESEDEKSNTDGLIFTAKSGNYFETKILKWKPVRKTTIDFLYVPEGDNFVFTYKYGRKFFQKTHSNS